MVFVCDNCHFLSDCAVEPEQCPDCGKQTEYAKRLEEPAEDW